MKRTDLVALAAGVVFALGLGLSGMTEPSKVIGFLDVSGDWDPSLAFVMIGAIVVHMGFALRARSGEKPVFADTYVLPARARVDGRLLSGAALFGVGWGIAGYCPGPAVVSLVTLAPTTIAFVSAMVAGMVVHALVFERAPRDPGDPEPLRHRSRQDARE